MENLEKLDVATKNHLGSTQLKNSLEITNVEDNTITKVLTVCANPIVENISVSNGEVTFDGNVIYDLLVVLDNNEIKPITEKSKFSSVFENKDISPDSLVSVIPNLVDLSSSNSKNGEFTFNSIIDFEFILTSKDNEISCAVAKEDVFCREEEIEYFSLINNCEYDFIVSFDLQKDSKINKILCVKNFATIKSIMPNIDYFVVSGEIYSTVVYCTEDGVIKCMVKEDSFSEEIEAKGVDKDTILQGKVVLKEAVVRENDDNSKFVIEIPAMIYVQAFSKNTRNCICDAYSTKFDINLTTSSFIQDEFVSTKQIEENVLTNFSLTQEMSRIDKILAVIPTNIRTVNQVVKDNELLLDGIGSINIIYYAEDDECNNELNSVDVDFPFSLSIQLNPLSENSNIVSSVIFGDINVKSKHGKELEILAEVKLNFNVTNQNVLSITTELVVGDEKPQRDYALEIYVAKSTQTLFDIGKELNISVNELVNQNKDISLPLNDGDKIVAYNKLEND